MFVNVAEVVCFEYLLDEVWIALIAYPYVETHSVKAQVYTVLSDVISF
jgi:hypothetical protein